MTTKCKYVEVPSGTTKDQFIKICKKFADILKINKEDYRIEFLSECLENASFRNEEIFVSEGYTWLALIDDGGIAQMEEGETFGDAYELCVLPASKKEKYFIANHSTSKADLTDLLERFADHLNIWSKPERYTFIGLLLQYDVPFFTFSIAGDMTQYVHGNTAIYSCGECYSVTVENDNDVYYRDTTEKVEGDRITL